MPNQNKYSTIPFRATTPKTELRRGEDRFLAKSNPQFTVEKTESGVITSRPARLTFSLEARACMLPPQGAVFVEVGMVMADSLALAKLSKDEALINWLAQDTDRYADLVPSLFEGSPMAKAYSLSEQRKIAKCAFLQWSTSRPWENAKRGFEHQGLYLSEEEAYHLLIKLEQKFPAAAEFIRRSGRDTLVRCRRLTTALLDDFLAADNIGASLVSADLDMVVFAISHNTESVVSALKANYKRTAKSRLRGVPITVTVTISDNLIF